MLAGAMVHANLQELLEGERSVQVHSQTQSEDRAYVGEGVTTHSWCRIDFRGVGIEAAGQRQANEEEEQGCSR